MKKKDLVDGVLIALVVLVVIAFFFAPQLIKKEGISPEAALLTAFYSGYQKAEEEDKQLYHDLLIRHCLKITGHDEEAQKLLEQISSSK